MANKQAITLELGVQNAQLIAGLNQAKGELQKFSNVARSLAGWAAGMFGTAELINGLKSSYLAAEESAKVQRVLEATLKATGYASGMVGDEMASLAEKLMDISGVDDEVIKGAESILVTFRNIGKDVFPEAMQVAMDMSTVMGSDLNSAVLQLGKALNDPIQGVTALRRVGVQFTAQQKEQIEALVKNNQGLEAQKIILNELVQEFGGATAAGKTATKTLQTAIGEMQESFGNFLDGGVGSKLMQWLIDTAKGWEFWANKVRIATSSINELSMADLNKKRAENWVKQEKVKNTKDLFGRPSFGAQEAAELNRLEKEDAAITARMKALDKKKTETLKNSTKKDFNLSGGGTEAKKNEAAENTAKEIRALKDLDFAYMESAKIKKAMRDFGLTTDNKYYSEVFDLFKNYTDKIHEADNKIEEIENGKFTNKKALITRYEAQKQNIILEANQKLKDIVIKSEKELTEIQENEAKERGQLVLEELNAKNQAYAEAYDKLISMQKGYESDYDDIKLGMDIENELLSQGYSKEAEYFNELKNIRIEYQKELKKINETELADEVTKTQTKLSLDADYNAKLAVLTKDAHEKSAEKFKSIWQTAYTDLFSKTRSLSDILKKLFLDLAIQIGLSLNAAFAFSHQNGGFWGSLSNSIMSQFGTGFYVPKFHSGGTVNIPNNKEMLAMLKGGERVLSPSETQTYNNNTQNNQNPITLVYAPQVTTGAKAEDVLAVLQKHSREFIGVVNDGIQRNIGGIRTTIKAV